MAKGKTLQVRIPAVLAARLDRAADRAFVQVSAVVRRALDIGLNVIERSDRSAEVAQVIRSAFAEEFAPSAESHNGAK